MDQLLIRYEIKRAGLCHKSPTSKTIRTLMIIAPAVQGLLVAKVRGIYPSNRLLFGLTCWMMTYGTVPLSNKRLTVASSEISRNFKK